MWRCAKDVLWCLHPLLNCFNDNGLLSVFLVPLLQLDAESFSWTDWSQLKEKKPGGKLSFAFCVATVMEKMLICSGKESSLGSYPDPWPLDIRGWAGNWFLIHGGICPWWTLWTVSWEVARRYVCFCGHIYPLLFQLQIFCPDQVVSVLFTCAVGHFGFYIFTRIILPVKTQIMGLLIPLLETAYWAY